MEKTLGEQVGQPYKYYVFCIACASKLKHDGDFMWAMFGPQGLTDEEACLVCVEYESAWLKDISQQFACDGCGLIVAVAPSSMWFIEKHKEERV